MTMNAQIEMNLLRPQIRRDILVDTVGNLLLGLGLYAWFGRGNWLPQLLRTETFVVLSISTGLLGLAHLPARLRRMRRWNELRDSGGEKQ